MSPQTKTQPPSDPLEMSDSESQWVRDLTSMAEHLGLRAPTFPMPTETLDVFFSRLGYECNATIRGREYGDASDRNFTVAEAKRLHSRLEQNEYWQKFPNPCHDHKKDVSMLAIEVADWLRSLSATHLMAWTSAADWQWLLLILAGAIDPQTQADLLAICTRKLGLPAPTSDDFWGDRCEAVGQISRMIDAEPGSRALE